MLIKFYYVAKISLNIANKTISALGAQVKQLRLLWSQGRSLMKS